MITTTWPLEHTIAIGLALGLGGCGGGGGPQGGGDDGGPPPVGMVCTDPTFTTSDPNGGQTIDGYYVHNNMWNCGGMYTCTETLSACSYNSFFVIANANDDAHDGAVKSFPNVHKDYQAPAISSFQSITTTFAATSPHVGIYDVAYDIWLNGVASAGSNEIMIWTENFKQVPAGNKVDAVTLGAQAYDVYRTGDGGYVALVPTQVMLSGSIDLLGVFQYLMSKGFLATNSTIGQIDYGVEIVSTDGSDARFDFTDFSIVEN
jgi:glycosyl hydrolase family 12